jgi:hypothetical protein
MKSFNFGTFLKKAYYYQNMKKVAVCLLMVVASHLLSAQSPKHQSVFIYSFTRYVIWPDSYNFGDFEILVLGDTPVLTELKAMAQAKKVGERNIKITKINSVAEIRKANMLFIPSGKASEIEGVVNKVGNLSILIITEEPGLGVKGSDINFVVKDGKLAFELNQPAMTKQNLKASTELSRLAIMI